MKKHADYTLDELVEQITSSVDPSWDILKKIRFVYIELGLYLEKNTDFFMSVQHKVLNQFLLSKDEVANIYNDTLEDGNRKNWNKVICRSASIILSKCLNKLGIENRIVNTTNVIYFNEEDEESIEDATEIRHVFVNAKLDDNRSIFLTLAADLPYIQNNMETQMFGNLIGYKRHTPEGEVILYEGDEITDAVRIDNDELRQIDADLGYLTQVVGDKDSIEYVYNNYFFDKLRINLSSNKLYFNLLSENTTFYKKAIASVDLNLRDKNAPYVLNEIIMNICKYVGAVLALDYEYKEPFSFVDWKEKAYSYINNNDSYVSESFTEFLKVTESLVESIADLAAVVLSEEIDDKKQVTKCINRYKNKALYLSRMFLPIQFFPNYDNGKINQEYIAKKFEIIFPYIFSCNGERTDFNDLAYSEQIPIIKIVLPLIFNDIKDKDCINTNKRSKCLPCIYNIIRTYTLKMKSDDSYVILFEIDNSGDPCYFSFNLQTNRFKPITQTMFYYLAVNNIICSKDLNDKLNIEEVEDRRTK